MQSSALFCVRHPDADRTTSRGPHVVFSCPSCQQEAEAMLEEERAIDAASSALRPWLRWGFYIALILVGAAWFGLMIVATWHHARLVGGVALAVALLLMAIGLPGRRRRERR